MQGAGILLADSYEYEHVESRERTGDMSLSGEHREKEECAA